MDKTNKDFIRIEMHCHSSASDGEFSPGILAEKLCQAGVKYAALTDHDSIAGLEPFKQNLARCGAGFVTGIELTTTYGNAMIHLLGYGFHPDDKELAASIAAVEMLGDSDANIVPRKLITTKDAIRVIHAAGGMTILAHPLKTEPDFGKLTKIICDLQEYGLDGIESIYASDSAEDRQKMMDLAREKGLIISAGTDYHTGNLEAGIEVESRQWQDFRDAMMKISQRNANIHDVPAPRPRTRTAMKWFPFFMNILMPAAMALILFIVALFGLLLPYFEQSLLERKRVEIRDLTKVAIGVLDEAAYEVESGQMTLDRAQELAKRRIEAMRYGLDSKEYFWLQDLTPRILMHPYRPDLNNQDVSEFADARNVKIFVEFVKLAKEKGEGFISYVWQWNDMKDRLEAKESYIRLFPKWGWIIGTGIYDKEVKDEIAVIRGYFVQVSFTIVFIVLLLLIYLVRNGLKIETSRRKTEILLHESIERYRALTEAATEGALFISKSRCRYANAVMYELLGCNESHLDLLGIDDVFPDVEANRSWKESLNKSDFTESKLSVRGIIKRRDGSYLNCGLTFRREASQSGDEFMVLVRRNLEGNEYNERKLDLEKLLQLPSSIASDITEAISRARQVNDVVVICGRTQELVQSLLENAASSIEITKMLSTVTDSTVRKLINIAISEIGTPPVDYVFLGLGSHGRESQTLYSDQDNAIIYRLDDGMDNAVMQDYFHTLASRVCEGLVLTGYRKCEGQKMADNPEWCQPLQVWKKYFEDWIKHSSPEDMMEFSVFFDFRAVAGDFELARELRSHVYAALVETPHFFGQLAKNALMFNPPIRLFGNIVTDGKKEHPGQIDVKAPNLAIVSFVRLYALKQGILETNTIARLDAITRTGILLDSTRRDIVTAYEAVLRLRLWNQSLALQNNQVLSNWVAPSQLGHIEEVILKECIKEIELLQERIQRDFFGGNNIF